MAKKQKQQAQEKAQESNNVKIQFSEVELLKLEKAQLADNLLKIQQERNMEAVGAVMSGLGARCGVDPSAYRIDLAAGAAILRESDNA